MTVPNAHDKVVQLIRIKGPVLPSQINKELDTNIMFASAILSELVDKKTLKISALKVGGSPLYYAPGQEYKLQQYADKLHPKEKEAYDLLRQKTVLKDDKQAPAVRVALRDIRDFARPLQVTLDGVTHIFWKWYLLPNEEAEKMIKGMLDMPLPKKPEPEAQKKAEPKVEHKIERQVIKQEIKPRVEPRPEPKQVYTKKEPEPRAEHKKEVQKELKMAQERMPEQIEAVEEPKDKFFRKVKKYFEESRITLIDYKVIRKESEIEFTVKIPSTVGTLTYFCKAKNKKKISDGDMSSLYVQAQSKKMPVLFLTTGELTKKAKELSEKEFKNISVKQI